MKRPLTPWGLTTVFIVFDTSYGFASTVEVILAMAVVL